MIKTTKLNTILAATIATLLSAPVWSMGSITLTDTNGDGVISAEEVTLAKDAKKAEAIAQYDTDGDGELSRAEYKAMKQENKASKIAAHDTDGDGELSRSERMTARAAARAAIELQLDVNQDGVVSDEEGAGFDEVKESRHGKKRHSRKKDGKRHQQDATDSNEV